MEEIVKRGPGRPRKDPVDADRQVPVRLLRDYWPISGDRCGPISGDRCREGEIIDLPIDEAREVIAKGIAERADEL